MSILTPFFNLIKPQKTDRIKAADMASNFDTIDTEMHRPPLTVNGILPNHSTRNIAIESVPLADNLSSDDAQFNQGTFIERMSGGAASISDGDAALSTIKGNMVKTGYVAEEINMTVNAVPRVAPAAITATLDAETFEAYVETAGTYTLTYLESWSADPADYGVTVSNTPVSGDEIVIVWDGESEPEMTVNAVERPVPAAITATLDRDTFVAYVTTSGTVTLSYTTAWSANPALYGITVQNTPVSGDSIVVVYVKENRGTITPANISAFSSTGWNLYDNTAGYAKVVKYSDDYGFLIGGSYSLVNFATTPTGTQSAVNVDANGYFNVPSDGYVIIVGGDATTYVLATWSDWTEGYEGDFETYTVDTIDLSEVMLNFSAGLLSIGDVRDEINFNTQYAISRIQRLDYTAENLASVIASGQQFDTDTNYIYVVRQNAVETAFTLDGSYTVSDHGIEFYTATSTTPPITEAIYGDNLKDKLRTDVLTISQQTLTATQKEQARSNIDAASKAEVKPFTVTLDAVSNTSGSYTHTTTGLDLVTEDMKAINLDVGTPDTFQAPVTITTGNHSVTLTCSNVKGTSTVNVTLIRTQPVDLTADQPATVTSTEFNILADRIGSLSNLTTSTKTSTVAAVNELNGKLSTIDYGSVSINTNVASGSGRVYKLGNWVVIFVNIITTGTIDTSTVIGTVPAGFRPNGTIEIHWEYQQPNNTYTSYNTYMSENTSGEIKQSVTGSVTIGSIIRIMHVYLIS